MSKKVKKARKLPKKEDATKWGSYAERSREARKEYWRARGSKPIYLKDEEE